MQNKYITINTLQSIQHYFCLLGRESTIADAIMDRLAVNAHRFDLKGESLRKKI